MSELIRNFGIDWRILLAQAVNFLILLIILKRFAYGPVLRMLKKRKEEIAKGLRFTKEAEEKIKRIGEEREEMLKETRGEALAIVSDAENTAKKRKDEIVASAHQKSDSILQDAKRAVTEEKAKMGEDVYKNAQDLLRLGLAKILGKMPAKDRDEGLIDEALKELKAAK